MHFHKHEYYGLLFMAELSGHESARPLSLVAMSERHGVSVPFLKKIVRSLKSHGLVESKEGVGGGYTLARGVDMITLWDIISSFIAVSDVGFPGGSPCPIHTSCLPQHIRHILHKRMRERLETITLQEVLP